MSYRMNLSIIGMAIALCMSISSAFASPPATKPEVFAPGMISGPEAAASPAFTPDGKTVFFMRQVNGSFTILESHLVNGKWSTPVEATFSGKWRDLDPAMAPDGSYLLFVSNRPVKPGGKRLDAVDSHGKVYPGFGMNIWRVDRQGNGWGTPVHLPEAVNNSTSTFAPSIAADGSVYFIGHDNPGEPAHLLRSQYRNGHYLPATRVRIGDADATIRDPAIAPNQSFIVFSSKPANSKAPLRLHIAFATDRGWGKPVDLGDAVNGTTYNMGSRLGPDHRTLYYYNASGNILRVSLTPWLDAHGIGAGVPTSSTSKHSASKANRAPDEPKIFAEDIVSTGHEFTLTLTPDMRTAYFTRTYPDKKIMHILRTVYRNGKWQNPVPVSFSSSKWSDLDPTLSPDGKRLFFISTRPVPGASNDTNQNMDIWVSVREGNQWGSPRHVKDVNSPGKEGSPTVSSDGTLCFFSDRNRKAGENSIYCVRPTAKGYGKPRKLGPAINSGASDTSPYLSPNGKVLLFYSTRSGGYGKADLYVSFKTLHGWSPAKNLGRAVNTAAFEYNPELSPDRKILFFGRSGNIYRIPLDVLKSAGIGNRIALNTRARTSSRNLHNQPFVNR